MDWQRIELREFCRFLAGGNLKLTRDDYQHEGYPAFSAAGQDGFVAVAEFDEPGIVVSSIGARCGRAFLAADEWTTLAGTYVIFPNTEIADPKFLWYQLDDEASWIRSGSRQPFLRPSDIQRRRVALAPLAEQRRVVEILDQVDPLRQLRADAVKKTDRILPALFLKMFGDPITNPMGWRKERLSSLASIVSGDTPTAKESRNYGNNLPWATPADLDKGLVVERTERGLSDADQRIAQVVPARSVLVVCMGAKMGKTGLAGSRMAIDHQISAIFPSSKLIPEFTFVQCVLLADRLRAASTKSTFPVLGKAGLGNLRIIVPPIKLQEELAIHARSLSALNCRRSALATRLESLFSALLAKAFSGDLTATWRDAVPRLLLALEDEGHSLAGTSSFSKT